MALTRENSNGVSELLDISKDQIYQNVANDPLVTTIINEKNAYFDNVEQRKNQNEIFAMSQNNQIQPKHFLLNMETLRTKLSDLSIKFSRAGTDQSAKDQITNEKKLSLNLIHLNNAINNTTTNETLSGIRTIDPSLINENNQINIDKCKIKLAQLENEYIKTHFENRIVEAVTTIVKPSIDRLTDAYTSLQAQRNEKAEQLKQAMEPAQEVRITTEISAIDELAKRVENKKAEYRYIKDEFKEIASNVAAPVKLSFRERWENFKLTFREGGKPDGKIKAGRVAGMIALGALLAVASVAVIAMAATGVLAPISALVIAAVVATATISGMGVIAKTSATENMFAQNNDIELTIKTTNTQEIYKVLGSKPSVDNNVVETAVKVPTDANPAPQPTTSSSLDMHELLAPITKAAGMKEESYLGGDLLYKKENDLGDNRQEDLSGLKLQIDLIKQSRDVPTVFTQAQSDAAATLFHLLETEGKRVPTLQYLNETLLSSDKKPAEAAIMKTLLSHPLIRYSLENIVNSVEEKNTSVSQPRI